MESTKRKVVPENLQVKPFENLASLYALRTVAAIHVRWGWHKSGARASTNKLKSVRPLPWCVIFFVAQGSQRRFQDGGWVLWGFQQNMGALLSGMEGTRPNKGASDGFHWRFFQLWFYNRKWRFPLPGSWRVFHHLEIFSDGSGLQGECIFLLEFP